MLKNKNFDVCATYEQVRNLNAYSKYINEEDSYEFILASYFLHKLSYENFLEKHDIETSIESYTTAMIHASDDFGLTLNYDTRFNRRYVIGYIKLILEDKKNNTN